MTLLFLILFGTTSIFAQTPAETQENTEETLREEIQTETVSDADLKKFTDAYREIQDENQKAQERLVAIIEKEGLDVNRFSEIHQASLDPNSELEVSEDEMAKHDKANMQLEKMQSGFQQKMESIVKGKGLTMERFDAIFQAVQSDPSLQQKVQDLMMKG